MLACHIANEDTVQFSMTSERSHYVSQDTRPRVRPTTAWSHYFLTRRDIHVTDIHGRSAFFSAVSRDEKKHFSEQTP